MNNVNYGKEKLLIKFWIRKLRGTASILESKPKIQNNHDKLVKWVETDTIKFNNNTCKTLQETQMHTYHRIIEL